MRTALVISPLVVDGQTYAAGGTVTLPEKALAPFVALSLASWVAEGEVPQTAPKVDVGAAENLADKDQSHGG